MDSARPTLGIQREQLQACGTSVGTDLAATLGPFVEDWAFAGLFDGRTARSVG